MACVATHAPAWRPATRRTVVMGVLGVHAIAAWALLQLHAVRQGSSQTAPLFASLIAAPAVPPPAPAEPAPPPRPQVPVPPVLPAFPLPAIEAAVAPPTPAITSSVALADAAPHQPALATPAAPPAPAATPASQAPPAPAAPRAVAASAVRYLVEPDPAYPPISRRLGETGEVRLRVEIGTDGRARQVSVHHSSGFPRLDESAVAAVRAARFAPFIENGVALVVWTIVPIAFELRS